jgi:hypothetical protein
MIFCISDRSRHDLERRIALHEVNRRWNKIPPMEGNRIAKPMLPQNLFDQLAPWERTRWRARRRRLMSLAQALYASVEGVVADAIARTEQQLQAEFSHINRPTEH